MNALHEHWQEMEDDALPVPIRYSKSEQNHAITDAGTDQTDDAIVRVPRGSRSPAALIGMVLFAGIFASLLFGTDNLLGQTTDEEMTISITDESAVPDALVLKPGGYFIFRNDSEIPHIIASDTLPISSNIQGAQGFETPAILPQTSFRVDIPDTVPSGLYSYFSRTSVAINGSIEILSATVATSAALQQPSSIALPVLPPSSSVASISSAPTAATELPDSDGISGDFAIPRNPYAVGSALPASTQYPTQQTTASITKHTPISQPETGSGMWLSGLALLGALLFVLKKAAIL